MQKTRNLRRHLTKRYQQRQSRLRHQYWGGWEFSETVSKEEYGRWRRHSWKDCGNSRCCMCDNPRRVGWLSSFEKLTLQEKRFSYNLNEELDEYYAS